jgi:hypothetical protein
MLLSVIAWAADFLKDGQTGGNSSSRLIAFGAATIQAIYLAGDIVSRLLGMGGLNESVCLACVAGLVTLGGGVYIANRVAGAKQNAE